MTAVNPLQAIQFFIRNGIHGFIILGSVFLVVTGGEALYADMGHFGKKPIRIAWFAVVLPALLLNYFGQGALLLETPAEAENPFYHLAPDWALVSDDHSGDAGDCDRFASRHFRRVFADDAGDSIRIYSALANQSYFGQRIRADLSSRINWALMVGCIIVVLSFQTSSNLAAAYGIAVTSTMVITTVLFYVVAHERWKWGVLPTALLCGFFMIIDIAFFGANIIKFFDGGWFPLTLAGFIFIMMMTWKKGRSILTNRIQNETELLEDFLVSVEKRKDLHRVTGMAVFMNGNATRTPPALLHNIEHNKILHERILFVTVKTRPIPYVEPHERMIYQPLNNGFSRLKIYYGYMEEPDIPKILSELKARRFVFNPKETTYFLGRETIIATKKYSGMARWREKLFAVMTKNARSATSYFKIPPDRVVELGEQIEI